MSDSPIPEVKHALARLVTDELTPETDHAGFLHLQNRYLRNGHINRLIDSYGRIIPSLKAGYDVAVLGASPLEGFFLSRAADLHSCRLYGSQEHLVYKSNKEFSFSRTLTGVQDCQVYSVNRHNLETPLPDKDEAFDAIICLEVLEHLRRDPLEFMTEVRRTLRAGGSLYLSTPNMNSARAIFRALNWESPMFFPSFGPPPAGIIHAHEYSLFELLALLKHAGFQVETVDSFDHPITPSFNHDTEYRSKRLLDEDTLARFRIESVETSVVENLLGGSPHRGDYLFVQASRACQVQSKPYAPLFCLFDEH